MTVLLFNASCDWETVHRNRINFAAREKVLNSHQMLIFLIICLFIFIYLFKSQILRGDKGASTLNDNCVRHEILFTS